MVRVVSPVDLCATVNYSITAFSENYSQKWMYLEKYGGPLSAGDTVTFTPTDDNVVINTGNYLSLIHI